MARKIHIHKLNVNHEIEALQSNISQCNLCAKHLNHSPNPIFNFNAKNKILIIGQAPGSVANKINIPWNDKSGDNLRKWMNVDKEIFYDNQFIGFIPIGFCYPGKGKNGDLPPQKKCAPLWHNQILDFTHKVELIILIGKYAQNYYLGKKTKKNLTDTVRNFQDYLPRYFVLPHPSPRNNIWLKRNDWFKKENLPVLKKAVSNLVSKKNNY